MSKTKKITLGVIGVLLIFSLVIGISYAAWRLTLTQTNQNTLASSCFDITFEEENPILLENTFPMYDEDGKTLTPYTFTITNNCSAYATYQIQLEIMNTSTLKDEYLKIMIDEKNPVILNTLQSGEKTLSEASRAYIIDNNALDVNEEKTYNIRVWLDENVTTETEGVQNSNWSAKITINAQYSDRLPTDYEKCVANYGEDSINCKIIAQLDTTGACPTVNDDGTVLVTGEEEQEGYVCSAPDDYGTSYYFRGNVENNWVKFADTYWRIIRINGDGSIRMIYAGDATVIDALENREEVLKNGYNDSNTDYTRIGISAYNSSYNDNAYVGYMYGTPASSSYEETHANINNSTIKTKVDEWYESHIKDTEYEQYISDTLFCNDRSISEYKPSDYINSGIGKEKTAYRWYYDPWDSNKQYPRLTCSQQNDRFTVNDEILGNGSLTYPIGLVNTDEVLLAGGYSSSNSGYYLYTGKWYWTMSPRSFDGSGAFGRIVDDGGDVSHDNVNVSYGVRPGLNLKSDSLKKGSGTANDPYTV